MGERADLPLGLHVLKSKAGISLTHTCKLSLYKLPSNPSNLAEILCQGCFIFSICRFILESCCGDCGRLLDALSKR